MMKSKNRNYFSVALVCLGLTGCAGQAGHDQPVAEHDALHDVTAHLAAEPLNWTREEPATESASPAGQPVLAQEHSLTAAPQPAAEPVLPASLLAQKERYHPLVNQVSDEFGLDAELLHAMIRVESGYQPQAVSPKGARGLMQVMPATGERFGFRDLMDPHHNLRAGASYMQWLLNHFNNDLTLALAAYNAGEGAVKRHGKQIPPYPETQHYVQKVLTHYQPSLHRQSAAAAAPQAQPPEPAATESVVASPVERISGKAFAEKLLGLLLSAPDAAPASDVADGEHNPT